MPLVPREQGLEVPSPLGAAEALPQAREQLGSYTERRWGMEEEGG